MKTAKSRVLVWHSTCLAALILIAVGCTYQPRRVLTVASTPQVVEGQNTKVTITVKNTLPYAIVPVSMNLYARSDPTEYFATRRILGEVDYLKPLEAAAVRHLTTLNRVEAQHVRDAGAWRRVPDTRFLHPRILMHGQSLSQTFDIQAYESYRRILYCDLFYFRLDNEALRDRVYKLDTTKPRPPKADRYTDVYVRIDETHRSDPNPSPKHYLLYRRRVPAPNFTRTITKRVPVNVRPRPFSYRKAASRARFAPRAHVYLEPAGVWVFDYNDGTWFVGPVATIKLRGHYIKLVSDLQRKGASTLTLTAPRKHDDKLIDLFRLSGYSDPKSTGPTVSATIPLDSLLRVLQQAESLGYTITATTWQPMPASQ